MRSSSPNPYDSWDRCLVERVGSPWVSMLVAPTIRPLCARNDHLLTSSTTYSWWANHDPEQPTSRLTLPVNRIVPGSTVCQQKASNAIRGRSASATAAVYSTHVS